tara:strand:- start:207 stop:455 length:249 start_codon:yes stop_codon:yes gene_type:complete
MNKNDNHKSDLINKSLKSFQKIVSKSNKASTASYTLIASVFIFLIGGNYFDKLYDSSPKGLIFGLCFGLIIGFYNLANAIWR